jgi:uncharacterized membrane protein YdbT with pleckstrin-like domain
VVSETGEEVLFHGHPSWRSMLDLQLKGVLAAVAAGVIVGLISAAIKGSVQVAWVIAAVLVVLALTALVGFIRRLATTYTITSHRLTIRLGLLSRQVHDTRLDRVQNVGISQSLLERMLGIGTVDFDTAGGAGFDFAFRGIADPKTIGHTVNQALQQQGREPI